MKTSTKILPYAQETNARSQARIHLGHHQEGEESKCRLFHQDKLVHSEDNEQFRHLSQINQFRQKIFT